MLATAVSELTEKQTSNYVRSVHAWAAVCIVIYRSENTIQYAGLNTLLSNRNNRTCIVNTVNGVFIPETFFSEEYS